MKLFILFASASVFFILQAIYWIVASRRASRQAVLAERLGAAEDLDGAADILKDAGEPDGWLEELSFTQSLRDLLEQAGDEGAVGPFLSRTLMAFLGAFAFFLIVTADLAAALVFGLGAMMLPYLFLLRRKRLRISRIEEQLPEALEVMTISLRAGQSLAQTIGLTAREIQAPLGDELRRVAEEQQLGRPLDEALVAMSRRLREARTVRSFVVSVLVLRQTGGNLIEVLESIIDTMRQQSQYERKLKAMTAEGRSSSRMLAALPPAFVMLAYLADPGYIGNLISDSVGRVLLSLAVILYVVGLIWVRRLVSPKV